MKDNISQKLIKVVVNQAFIYKNAKQQKEKLKKNWEKIYIISKKKLLYFEKTSLSQTEVFKTFTLNCKNSQIYFSKKSKSSWVFL